MALNMNHLSGVEENIESQEKKIHYRRNSPPDYASIETGVNYDELEFNEKSDSEFENKNDDSLLIECRLEKENQKFIPQNLKPGPNVNMKIPKKKPFYTIEERNKFCKQLKFKEKTELCKNWVLYNDCFYKDSCSFAHGEKELRLKKNIQLYKTKPCKSFMERGFCCYGNRCQYLHIVHEKRIVNYKYLLKQFCYKISTELSKTQIDSQNIIHILKYINSRNQYPNPRLEIFERV